MTIGPFGTSGVSSEPASSRVSSAISFAVSLSAARYIRGRLGRRRLRCGRVTRLGDLDSGMHLPDFDGVDQRSGIAHGREECCACPPETMSPTTWAVLKPRPAACCRSLRIDARRLSICAVRRCASLSYAVSRALRDEEYE